MEAVNNNESEKTDLEVVKRKREEGMSGHKRNVQAKLVSDVERDSQSKKRKREDNTTLNKPNAKAKQNQITQNKQKNKKVPIKRLTGTSGIEQIAAKLKWTSKSVRNEEEGLTRKEIMIGKSLQTTLSVKDDTQKSKKMSDLKKSNVLEDDRNLKAGGLKNNLHGELYQWSLLSWAALKSNPLKQFQLITEAAEFQKFDDLVLKYNDKIILLQAKHSSKQAGIDNYKQSDFTSNDYNEDASLAKYFDSWFRLERSIHKKKDSHYIFWTNRGVEEQENFLEDYVIELPELELGGKTLRFKTGDCRKEFLDAIRANSEEVKSNSKVSFSIEDIEKDELGKATSYLENKFKEGKNTFQVDSRSKLTKKAQAIIRVAQTRDDVLDLMKKDEKFKDWLRAKENDHYKIQVSLKNPEEIFSKALEKEINNFLDQFILKIEQPNLEEMFERIQSETANSTPIAADEFCKSIKLKVLMWLNNLQDCDLSSEEIKKIRESAKGDALRFYLLIDNMQLQALEGVGLSDIENILDNNKDTVIRIEHSPGIELRIAQTIKDKKIKQDQYAFINKSSNCLEHIATILQGEQIQVAVFNYSNDDDNVLFNSVELKKVLEIVEKNRKKIILLTRKDDTRFDQYGEKVQVENNLSDEQIKSAISNNRTKVINIAGKNYKLSDLVTDSGIYQVMKRANFLYEVLNQDNQKTEELKLGLPHNVYIENQLVKGEPVYQLHDLLSHVEAGLFVIKGKTYDQVKEELEKYNFTERVVFDNQTILEEEKSTKKYRLIQSQKVLNESMFELNIKHIYVGDNLSDRVKAAYQSNYVILNVNELDMRIVEYGKEILFPIADKYSFKVKKDVSRGAIKKENFCIISAPAGHGKSSFCLHQREQWIQEKTTDQYSWLVRLDLSRLEFRGQEPTAAELFNKKASSVDWSEWQLEALNYDMQRPNKVTILLDGFDEIKDPNVIQKLGFWISTLHKETKLMITTRPYAAHNIPMPENRKLDLFLTLNGYTDVEKNQYIKKYIKALTGEKKSGNVRRLIAKYQALIANSPKNIRSTFGIPLECYLYCAGFESEIITDYQTLKNGGEISSAQNTFLNSVDLFEKFLQGKLLVFLQKHLQVENHLKLRQDHFLYTSTSLYTDMLQAFSFRQVFNLDYKVVSNVLRDRYYDVDVINDLQDTGFLVTENNGKELCLKFNHETYQEYFAALKIVSGLLSENQDVLQVFNQYKHYVPNYQVVFQFAAQISLTGSRFLSRFDLNQDQTVQKFWAALFGEVSGNADILGVAESNLIQRCLRILSNTDLEVLKKSTVHQPWHKKLIDLIKPEDVMQEIYDTDQVAPVERMLKEEHTDQIDENKVKDQLHEYCKYKIGLSSLKTYINSFSKLHQNQVRKILAAELTLKKEWDDVCSYWALDFGIPAVGLCGECFTLELADKLIFRSNEWKNNFEASLNSLSLIYNDISDLVSEESKKGTKQKLFYTVGGLLDSKFVDSFTQREFSNFKQISKEFLEYLGKNLSLLKVLSVAAKVNYAVVVSADYKVLHLIGEDEVTISLNEGLFQRELKIFKETEKNDPKSFIKVIRASSGLKKLARQHNLRAELSKLELEQLRENFKTRFYDLSKRKDINKLEEFFDDLKEVNLYNIILLAKQTLTENFFAAKHEANEFWECDFGAKALKYCGHYITENMSKLYDTKRNSTSVVNDIKASCAFLFQEFVGESEITEDLSGLKEISIELLEIVKVLSENGGAQELKTNVKKKIEYLQNIELHSSNGLTLHQTKVFLECIIMLLNCGDMN